MAWVKKPYKTGRGRRYAVGYADHEGRERSHGGFTSRGSAADWADAVDGAAAEGHDELKSFLERTFRKETPDSDKALTLGDGFSLWWAQDADPELPDGLAKATGVSYLTVWNLHIQPRVGGEPLSDFARPGPCSRLLRDLRTAGAGDATVKRARAVLSSMLSWATEQEHVSANGVSLVQRRRRRSTRGGRRTPNTGHQLQAVRESPRTEQQGRALSPRAVAAIHRAQLADPVFRGPTPLRPQRDATVTVVNYLIGCRPQELWGLRWEDVTPRTTSFIEVVSYGALDAGKTSHSRRSMPTPALLREVLDVWRETLTAAGRPPAPTDFIFGGRHPEGHFTADQARLWPRYFFTPVCKGLAGKPLSKQADQERYSDPDIGFAYLARATQYSLRRGHMSLRLRAGEDSVAIAKQCGTSVEMLYRHYADSIAEAGVDSRSVEEQLREALDWSISTDTPRRLLVVG
jgi:integrase